MVALTDVLNLLVAFSIVLSMYTARLVCNDPSYDRLNIPLLTSLRKFAGCPNEQRRHQPAEQSANSQKTANASASVLVDKSAPSWVKIVATMDRTDIWKKSGLDQAAQKRVPSLMKGLPLKDIGSFDTSIAKDELGIWGTGLEIKKRVDGGKVFARENYPRATGETPEGDPQIFGVFEEIQSQYPSGPSSLSSPYFEVRHNTLKDVISSMWATGEHGGVGEFASDDLGALIDIPMDDLVVSEDPNEGKEKHVMTVAVEPPGTAMAAQYSVAHSVLVQLVGSRTVLLFPPERWFDLAMYPAASPRRRQSMLDFTNTPLKNKTVASLRLELHPGDVLYIPPFWSFRTYVPEVSSENLLPSAFSISAIVATVSAEYKVKAVLEKITQVSEVLSLVTTMGGDNHELQAPAKRSRAAAGWIVKELYDRSGMKSKEAIQQLVNKRLRAPVELQSDFLNLHGGDCREETNMESLEGPARELIRTYTDAVVNRKGLVSGAYEHLDERMGAQGNRVTAVWRILIEEIVEKVLVTVGGVEYVELASCIAKDMMLMP